MPSKALSIAVRCRTILPHDHNQRVCVRVVGNREITCLDPEHLHAELREKHGRHDYLKENHCRERAYTFDAVFGAEATNEGLFQQLAEPLLPEVLAGKHATCFAYGQTGSGKTHTMFGRQGEAGIVERALQKLLSEATLGDTKVVTTFVEVYNEKIRDLLHSKCPVLDLREDALRGPCISGVYEACVSSVDGVMQLVRAGNARRTEETTAANPVSSRSHAVLQVSVETWLQPALAGGGRKKRVAKFSLIDLAGSERAANTGNRGARLREGAMINRSLLALANCITALTRKGAYVNYRDSKLTRLLKDSLCGNCFTVMIAHVSPSIASFEETINTLKYAHRACEIRGMCGGVRENVYEAPARYADRMGPCLEATSGLKHAVEQLTVPRIARKPLPRHPKAVAHDNKGVAIQIADELEKTRQKVLGKMRERVRIEQTVLELKDQNESNVIELSELARDAMLKVGGASAGVPGRVVHHAIVSEASSAEEHLQLLKRHGALRAATRNNDVQRRHAEQLSAHAEQVGREGDQRAKLVSLLADAKNVIESASEETDGEGLERRLLGAQHAISLLELENLEAMQQKALLEAATRQHELALRKQQFQLDVHTRALIVAEALLSKRGLTQEWHAALGPIAQLLPASVRAPSLDELIAEVSAPGSPAGSRPPSSMDAARPADDMETPPSLPARLDAINEQFEDLCTTLGRSVKIDPSTSTDEVEYYEQDFYNAVSSDDEDDDSDDGNGDSAGGGAGGGDDIGECGADAGAAHGCEGYIGIGVDGNGGCYHTCGNATSGMDVAEESSQKQPRTLRIAVLNSFPQL